jgi:exosortase/archaeosortase family protein
MTSTVANSAERSSTVGPVGARRAPISLSSVVAAVTASTKLRPAVALGVILVAYHTSIETLIEGLSLDTPLAHLALVPIIALLLAFINGKPKNEPSIHDRQLDWILGLPLVIGALAMNLLLPARLSTMFWVWRVDLLSLPFFVAGVLVLLFGVRTVWRIKAAVLFLFLAWPWPYNQMLDRWLGEFTNLTIAGLKQALKVIPLATPVAGGDGSLFDISHGTESVKMSVASACSGANGVVGFFLVGVAFMLVVQGSRLRKVLWLGMGALLVWVFNVIRIMVIFGAAARWGETVAIEGFHPFVGLIVFNLAVLVMMLMMRPFGLRLRPMAPKAKDVATGAPSRPYRPRAHTALASVTVIALALGVLNADLRSNDPVATSLGSPRLTSFAVSRETPEGWLLMQNQKIDWARRFFGSDSTWVRYVYSNSGDGPSEYRSNLPVYADVIETSSRNSLSAYGIEACYKFHGYKTSKQHSVDLGNGVVGGVLSWTNTDNDSTWTTLWWHWPIKTPEGTRYERMTLLVNDQPDSGLSAPEPSSDPTNRVRLDVTDAIKGGTGESLANERLAGTERFLTSFGQELVRQRITAK